MATSGPTRGPSIFASVGLLAKKNGYRESIVGKTVSLIHQRDETSVGMGTPFRL